MPAQRLVLAVSPAPFTVFITFVAGYNDYDPDRLAVPGGLKYVDGTHNVR